MRNLIARTKPHVNASHIISISPQWFWASFPLKRCICFFLGLLHLHGCPPSSPHEAHYARLHPYKLLWSRVRATWRQRHGSRLGPSVGAGARISSKHGIRSCAAPGAPRTRPNAVWPTARRTATERMLHQRLAHAAWAGPCAAGGARHARSLTRRCTSEMAEVFQRPPTSHPSSQRVWAPPRASSGYVSRLRRSATFRTAPSRVAM